MQCWKVWHEIRKLLSSLNHIPVTMQHHSISRPYVPKLWKRFGWFQMIGYSLPWTLPLGGAWRSSLTDHHSSCAFRIDTIKCHAMGWVFGDMAYSGLPMSGLVKMDGGGEWVGKGAFHELERGRGEEKQGLGYRSKVNLQIWTGSGLHETFTSGDDWDVYSRSGRQFYGIPRIPI